MGRACVAHFASRPREQMAVTCWVNRQFGYAMPNWATLNLTELGTVGFPVEQNLACPLCAKAAAPVSATGEK